MSTSTDTLAASPSSSGPPRLWLHIVLFLATLATTTHVGLMMSPTLNANTEGNTLDMWSTPAAWLEGFSFSLSIMAILLAHELGHYLCARRRGVLASLPYFIPMYSAFGTLGAFIRMRLDRPISRNHMMEIGAFGPLAGFAVALPVLSCGLLLSEVKPTPEDLTSVLVLGDSLLLMGLQWMIFRELPPNMDVWLHPMAYAGWAGMFVTALNLLPLSQLDGGHVAYCLFGRHSNRAAPLLFGLLLFLALVVFPGWLMLCVLLLIIGLKHPPTCDEVPLDRGHRLLGVAALVLLVLTFTPVPFAGMPTILELIGP